MFVTVPPGTKRRTPAAPPVLAWSGHVALGPRAGGDAHDPARRREMLRYLADMLAPHGVPCSAEIFAAGNHNSYASLMRQLLSRLEHDGLAPPELVVAAHTTPDCDTGPSLSGHLTTLRPGHSFCFALSDQGELSPFSALQAIRGLAASGWPASGRGGALMLAMDQSTLPYIPPSRSPGRAEPADHAVGLLFLTDAAAAGRPLAALRQRQAVPPEGVRSALAEIASGLPPAAGPAAPVTVLAGPGISAADLPPRLWDARAGADGRPAGPLVRTSAGAPCVTVWARLCRLLADEVPGRVLVTEYDRALGGLAVAVLDAAVVPARPLAEAAT